MWLASDAGLLRLSPSEEGERARIRTLIRELRASNVQLHREILEQLAPLVEKWVRAWMGPRRDPRDVTQEALCQIASALYRFEGRCSLATFAHRITLRVAMHTWKKDRRHEPLMEHHLEDAARDPSQLAERRQVVARLYLHLDQMREARRTAIILCELQGLPPTEAAEVVGCQPSAMRNRLFHAKKELAERAQRDPILSPRRPR